MRPNHTLLALFLTLSPGLVSADFSFFEQMFSGGGGGGSSGHEHTSQRVNPSDASVYKKHYEGSSCDRGFLCPDTLACVHFPHHCPCAWAEQEDKFELGKGAHVCVSKGGFKAGEAARKVELARKGLI